MASSTRVLIIGAGIQGLCCAYSLVLGGCVDVVVVDSETGWGGRSTKRSAAMLTRFTGHPETTRLADESIRLFEEMARRLTAATGIAVHFARCGFAIIGTRESAREHVRAEYREHMDLGLASELGDGASLNEMTGGLFRVPSHADVCLSSSDGFVNIDEVTSALVKFLKDAGVTLLLEKKATNILVSGGEVIGVAFGDELVKASVVVNAAGVLAGTVASWVGHTVPIRPSRKQLIGVETGRAFRGPIVENLDDGWYFRPWHLGMLVGVGWGEDEPQSENERNEDIAEPWAVDKCREYIRRWTTIEERYIESLSPARGWSGLRPIHETESLASGRSPAHLPQFGDPGVVTGYFESCGWGEFGVTLGPVGGARVASAILESKRA